MRKRIKRIAFCLILAAFVWAGSVLADRQQLNEQLIRFHVVANSDSQMDQAVKLKVRDAVIQSLQSAMEDLSDQEAAKAYLQENLRKIQDIANETLQREGFSETAFVTLCKETFDTRQYDTFTLPAGVYDSLRIVIGEGKGHNWWCVVFPALCLPATSEGFDAVAAGAGFSETLNETLQQEGEHEIRFFLLDVIGSVQNALFSE